jgi:hypothetical protein
MTLPLHIAGLVLLAAAGRARHCDYDFCRLIPNLTDTNGEHA